LEASRFHWFLGLAGEGQPPFWIGSKLDNATLTRKYRKSLVLRTSERHGAGRRPFLELPAASVLPLTNLALSNSMQCKKQVMLVSAHKKPRFGWRRAEAGSLLNA